MADRVDKATRSRIMAAIKSRDTGPELALEAAFRRARIRYRRPKPRTLPGSPDFTLCAVKLAVFVHGCFWHCCPRHHKAPQSGRNGAEGWRLKFLDNVRRDKRVRRRLRALGWRTAVVWEHEDMDIAAARLARMAARILREAA